VLGIQNAVRSLLFQGVALSVNIHQLSMPRTAKNEATVPVNVRIPEQLLQELDAISKRDYHDRTTEVITACKHWVEIDGNASIDSIPVSAVSEINKRLDELTTSVKHFSEIEASLSLLIKRIDSEHDRLLRIIEEGVKRR